MLRSVTFEGGSLVDGALPKETATDVKLLPLGGTVLMTPGDVSIMALDVENPDEADDPIETTLVHFERGGKHFAVTRGAKDSATGASDIENHFQVASDVCSELCNKKYSLKLLEAPKTRSGKIGRHNTRTLELDCTETGDENACGDSGDSSGDEPRDVVAVPSSAFDGDDDLIGTWDVSILDDGETLDCVITIAAGLTFDATCTELPEEYDVGCYQELDSMAMAGSIDANSFELTMDSIQRYSGATCIDYGYTPDVDYTELEVDAEGLRTLMGAGNLGGEWDTSFYDWECPGDEACEGGVGRVRGADPLNCSFSLDADGLIDVSCIDTAGPDVPLEGDVVEDCDSMIVVAGAIGDGQLEVEVTELSEGADCDPTNEPDVVVVSAQRR